MPKTNGVAFGVRARRLIAAALGLVAGLAAAGDAIARCEDWTPQPKPQNVGRDIVGQDYDTIIERGTILFAVYADYEPYAYREDGEPKGSTLRSAASLPKTWASSRSSTSLPPARTLKPICASISGAAG